MVIEVFKTNVERAEQARRLITEIQRHFSGYSANFDLDDCDRILRVVTPSGNIQTDAVLDLVSGFGFRVEVLPDEMPDVFHS